jgi:hypothetical protein
MSKFPAYLIAAAFCLFAIATVWAQDPASRTQNHPAQPTQADKPIQPDKPKEQGKSISDEPPAPPAVAGTVTNAPLTGANEPSFGIFSSRDYVVPALGFYGQLDSNGLNTPFGSFTAMGSILAGIDIQKTGRFSQLNLDYIIGRSFSNTNQVFNSTSHALNASALWSGGRWDGFVSNQFLYSSESSYLGGIAPFELVNMGSFAGLGQTGPIILRNSFQPDQGIFTNFGPRLSDALVGQVNNHLSRRAFFTLVGNYDTLHFFSSGLIDSTAAGFQTGIGYQRTHQDAIALVYRFSDLWFRGLPGSLRDNVVELAYQRRIAERMDFRIGAGPDISFIPAPNQVTGASSERTRVSWTADLSFHYQLRRMRTNFGYGHYLTNGGGVFLGSIRDDVYAAADRDLSRVWKVNGFFSYNRNANLIPVPTLSSIAAPAGAVYHSIFGGFELHRRVGRDSDLFFGYLARYQTANYSHCATGSGVCLGPNIVGHQFNFGFLWRIKPIPVG